MQLGFRHAAVQHLFNQRRCLVSEYGERGAKVIACRMQVLHAAPTLGFIPSEPPINLQPTETPEMFTVDLDEGAQLRFAVHDGRYDHGGVLLWRIATRLDILGVSP